MTRTKIIILNLAPKWQLSNFSFFVHEFIVGAYFKVCKVLPLLCTTILMISCIPHLNTLGYVRIYLVWYGI